MNFEFSRNEQVEQPFAWLTRACTYRVSMDGDRVADVEVPWPELLPQLAALEGTRSLTGLETLGRELQRVLRPAGWDRAEERISAALARGERPIVQLNSHAAELTLLPWELIPLSASGQRLGQGQVLLRYAWPGTRTLGLRAGASPGRLLFAWSDAGGPVPWTAHKSAIMEACARGAVAFDESTDILPHVSLRSLSNRLAQGGAPIQTLHLLCHGSSLADAPGTFGLTLDSPSNGPHDGMVDGAALTALLAQYAGALRLVVLCACRAAGHVAGMSQLGSVAHSLHRAGIQCVIASRSLLSIDGSISLTRRLYGDLIGSGATVEESFLRARAELNVHAGRRDWIDVQLLARAHDGDSTRLQLQRESAPPSQLQRIFAEHGIPFGAALNLARLRGKLGGRGRRVDHVLGALAAAGAIMDRADQPDPRAEALEDTLVTIWEIVASASGSNGFLGPTGSRVLKITAGVLLTLGGAGTGVGWLFETDTQDGVAVPSSDTAASTSDPDPAPPGPPPVLAQRITNVDDNPASTGTISTATPPRASQGGEDIDPARTSQSPSLETTGCLSLRTQNGVREGTRLSVSGAQGVNVAETRDTVLRVKLPSGTYRVRAQRTTGEPPVEHEVRLVAGTATFLCLDLTEGGGLCPGVDVEFTPLSQGDPCS